jgi:hypothetical protein
MSNTYESQTFYNNVPLSLHSIVIYLINSYKHVEYNNEISSAAPYVSMFEDLIWFFTYFIILLNQSVKSIASWRLGSVVDN